MHPLVVDTLIEEVQIMGRLMGDVVAGEGLAAPLAVLGGLLIAFSVGVVGILALGALLRPIRGR